MFVQAIATASTFTRPIHIITRYYRSTEIHPGAATLFFLNPDGWALTCKHVGQQLIAADQLAVKLNAFEADIAIQRGKKKEKQIIRELEAKHQFSSKTLVEIHNMFVNCIEGPLNVEIKFHQTLDIALLHFTGFTKLSCTNFPFFPRDTTDLKQGKFVCRLGFPFPEFTNYEYDLGKKRMNWTSTGKSSTPQFPIEGMVTRHLLGPDGAVWGFEMSTPGLRGQSGGPAFDTNGKVWGMQCMTSHLDLNFDVVRDVVRDGETRKVKDYAFLHVGYCAHVDALKTFMREHNVGFQEG